MELFLKIAGEFWGTLGEMAPYLLFGFLVAGILSVLVSPETVERHLGGRGFWPVFKAALFGVPLPLCSCGVIPVAASLRKHGASKGATTAFLLSTPQTGVDSIMVTFGLLGPVFAIFRPLAALFTGLLGGSLVDRFEKPAPERTREPADACTDECCAPSRSSGAVGHALRYGFVTLPRDIGRPMLIGLAVAGIIGALVPDDFFAGTIGTGFTAMLIMMLVGIPTYVCATASVPIAAMLIAKGVSPGAALVFLITGPATNAATMTVLWKTMGRRTTFIYLATVAVTALASGILLDGLFAFPALAHGHHMAHSMLPPWLNTASGVVLLAMLMGSLIHIPPPSRGKRPEDETVTARVTGMTCNRCADHVREALSACAGISSVQVDARHGTATITGTGFDWTAMKAAVGAAGYELGEKISG